MRVFLTGGTGLLGSHVAERLRESGYEVRVLVRQGSDTGLLRALGCELVQGDLGDSPEAHAGRMEGCEGVVHSAGEVYGSGSLAETVNLNAGGTRRVLEGAALAGTTSGVHISSVAVYGDGVGPWMEDRPWSREVARGNTYALSKRKAEEVVEELHGRRGLGVTILRPPVLFGERDRRFVPRVVRMLKGRVVLLPGSGRNRLAAVYAGNVAEAVERGLKGVGAGEAFNVSEDVGLTPRALLEGLGRAIGLHPHFISIPGRLARIAATLVDRAGIGVPGVRGLSLTRAVRLSMEDNPYPAEKARLILGWSPPYSLDEALARTGMWLRQEEERSKKGRGE